MTEWLEARLGDVCTVSTFRASPDTLPTGTRYLGMEHLATDAPLPIGHGSVEDVSSAVTPFQQGDTLFGRLRPYLRKVAFAEDEGVCSPEILVLRPRPGIIPQFLHLVAASQACIDHCIAASAGSRMPRTSAKDLEAFEFGLPPIDEQRRIVDLIGKIDAHIEALGAERVAAARLRSRVFSVATDDDEAALGMLCDVSQGKSLPKSVQGTRNGAVPWFKIADMTRPGNEFGYRAAETSLDGEHVARLGGIIAPVGSIAFPRVGAAVLTEKKRLLEVDGALDENHIVLTPKEGVPSEVLLAAVEHLRLSDYVRTGAVPSLNMGLVRSMLVPWGPRVAGLVDTLTASRVLQRELTVETVELMELRSSVLTALLSQAERIPETYDALFREEVAA